MVTLHCNITSSKNKMPFEFVFTDFLFQTEPDVGIRATFEFDEVLGSFPASFLLIPQVNIS
jgi:hypothetical protein